MKQLVCFSLFRLLLPVILLTAVIFRFNLFSFIYLILLLLAPALPFPYGSCIHSSAAGRYLKSVIGLSTIFCSSQIIFQISLLSIGVYGKSDGSFYQACEWSSRIMALVGFHKLSGISAVDCIRLLGLDYLVLFVTVAVLLICEKLLQPEPIPSEGNQEHLQQILQSVQPEHPVKQQKHVKTQYLLFLLETCILLLMAGAGILNPSLLSVVYFLTFLAVCTKLACGYSLGPIYIYGRIILIFYSALHFTAVYLYQFDYAQEFIPPKSLISRLLGLHQMVINDCEDLKALNFQPLNWSIYVSPILVYTLYLFLTSITRLRLYTLDSKKETKSQRSDEENFQFQRQPSQQPNAGAAENFLASVETSPLLEGDHNPHSYNSLENSPQRTALSVDPHGSIIWSSESDIPAAGDQNTGETEKCTNEPTAAQPSSTAVPFLRYRPVLSPIVTVFRLITKGSYVATLIIMMTWSITYHSWLTFVLLLWSCILWMTQNSRQACLRSSPALVMYAEVLLLLQYIYSLDLTDEELPTGVYYSQIGLLKSSSPYKHLAAKIAYTVMFWITMRQYMEEKAKQKKRDICEGVMREPFNISFSTVQPGLPKPDLQRQFSIATSGTTPNPYIRWMADIINQFLTKYWIWVVACMLMVISLGGEKVVVYRIVYMFLFLFFILMFQFSYQIWRRIMYGFWLTVIIFSMFVLIIIYTYQFQNFPDYWEKYLHIPKNWQLDIGLEVYKYDPGTLFLKLLIPTFFLIITIIQLHYFHKEFLRISDIHYRSSDEVVDQNIQLMCTNAPVELTSTSTHSDEPSTPVTPTTIVIDNKGEIGSTTLTSPTSEQGTAFEKQSDFLEDSVDASRTERELLAVKKCFEDIVETASKILHYFSELMWRLLEIHIIKIVLLSVMCLAIYDICALHYIFVIFVTIALPLKSLQTFLSHCCSVWTCILLLSKMIYQLHIVENYMWQTNCTNFINTTKYPFNETIDNRKWVGFERTDNLADYCQGYIGLILVLTIQAVIKIRQKIHRYHLNEAEPIPGVVFPDGTRSKADDDLLYCIKFLVNYFFYKFGVEMTFVSIVVCIGFRMDVFSAFYAFWLCIMFLTRRKTLAKIWPFYVTFLCIVIPLQYAICVGIPPGLCIQYPWVDIGSIKEWLYLADFQNPPDSGILVAEFFQTLFACCQLSVFKIEKGPSADIYEGGSNKEIHYEDADLSKNNPIPDFVTTRKSVLDRLKIFVFFSFYWVTLAIVFIAGTSRINLFGIGYVIGCFFFLWTGNEFYLKPMKTLLKWWKFIMAYNVFVIFLKAILQVVVCYLLTEKGKTQTILIQLFGIACKNNDASEGVDADTKSSLLWDEICFAFLIFQQRLFCSYYFQHLVNETQAQQVLASRGAELINEIQMNDVEKQRAAETEIMRRIKKKMDHIRSYQQKLRGEKKIEPTTYYQAIRSGDYYMFEEYSEEEIDLEVSKFFSFQENDDDNEEVKQKGLNALLSKTIKANLKFTADEPKKESEEYDDIEESSQQSPIVSLDRSLTEPATISESSLRERFQTPGTSYSAAIKLPTPTKVSASSSVEDFQEQLASTSVKDVLLEEEVEPKGETFVEKFKAGMKFISDFIESVLISATAKLNAVSKDYRYVAIRLSKEKISLKDMYIQDGVFLYSDANTYMRNRGYSIVQESTPINHKMTAHSLKSKTESSNVLTADCQDKEKKEQSTYTKFLVACYYAGISQSEILCYIFIIINQMKSASILSLPLPLMAFLWGTLSVPRPTKSFWITVITYTEAIVVVKYLFQFPFFPWNDTIHPLSHPFYWPRILGVEKKDEYTVFDLALLMVVFFHRFMLKSLGLWKDSERKASQKHQDDNSLSKSFAEDAALAVNVPEKDLSLEKDATSKSLQGQENLTESETNQENFTVVLKHHLEPMKNFFRNLLYPDYRVTVDVYAPMFFCDFVNFLIIVFGYSSFGTGGSDGGVASYFQEDKVPVPFLIMLIAQFGLIVADRALYLRKHILGKLVFQVINVFVVHLWMFFVLPAVTFREFVSLSNLPPKLWYFIKCIYFLLSAYQIRSGYPTRILGNFFCKKYNYINLIMFKGYMLIPFLYELRSLMDWIWTDTSMNIGSWLKMEDIYANIFILKCQRRAEEDYPKPRGEKSTPLIKYGVGGLLLFLIILIIWFPLLLFALGNTVGQANQPIQCSLQFTIEGYEPLLTVTAQKKAIRTLDNHEYRTLFNDYTKNRRAINFLTNYDQRNIAVIDIKGKSTSTWDISPPSKEALVSALVDVNSTIKMKVTWSFYRESNFSSDFEKDVHGENERMLTDHVIRNQLANMCNNTGGNVIIPKVLPNFIRLRGRGNAEVIEELSNQDDIEIGEYRDLTFSLHSPSRPRVYSDLEWWEVNEPCMEQANCPYRFLNHDPNDGYLRLVVLSDKGFPSELSVIFRHGIVGLYTTFVLVCSRLVRGVIAGTSYTIMFDDMPSVDRVLNLCLDIYLVRESGEFALEEDLFAKLIFLYRSPETLIKWTRPQIE